MSKNNSLSEEWKDSVYNFGGALVGLGKIMVRSVKVGVDAVYDKMNESEKKSAAAGGKQETKQSKPVTKIQSEDLDDEWDENR